LRRQNGDQLCAFKSANYPTTAECIAEASQNCPLATNYWSTDGGIALDLSNIASPVLRYPDGKAITTQQVGGYSHHPFPGLLGIWAPNQIWMQQNEEDRNGMTTTFAYDGNGWLSSKTDPMGRTTSYQRDPWGHVISVTAPGPAGIPQRWEMTWSEHT